LPGYDGQNRAHYIEMKDQYRSRAGNHRKRRDIRAEPQRKQIDWLAMPILGSDVLDRIAFNGQNAVVVRRVIHGVSIFIARTTLRHDVRGVDLNGFEAAFKRCCVGYEPAISASRTDR
jgi:hypothetical protein